MSSIGSDITGTRIRRLVATALEEDAATLDPSVTVFPEDHHSRAELYAKDDLVLAGQGMFAAVFDQLDGDVDYTSRSAEGERVDAGDPVGRLEGPTRTMLRGERTALNFLQRLSGIATRTAAYAEALAGSGTEIVDTRKTLPGFRELDKYAVRCGGGSNHRYNLAGGVIVKDNHIAAAGGIDDAVAAIRDEAPHTVRIEVEVESLGDAEIALDAGADILMLDNMSTDEMAETIGRVRDRAGDSVLIEASGNIRLDRLPELGRLDLDFVSSGALTHSVDAADLSLQFEEPR